MKKSISGSPGMSPVAYVAGHSIIGAIHYYTEIHWLAYQLSHGWTLCCVLLCFVLSSSHRVIEAEWRIHASVTKTIIGSNNGLLPVLRQAIFWTTAATLLIRTQWTHFSQSFIYNSKVFIQWIAHENVVCEMVAILSPPQCVNISFIGIGTITRFVWYQWSNPYEMLTISYKYFFYIKVAR